MSATGVLAITPGVIEAFSAANVSAGDLIALAASGDAAAMLSAVALTVGPIGVEFLLGYGPAQAANLASSFLLSAGHSMLAASSMGTSATMHISDTVAAL
ncbi:hypothetical protein QSJ18_13480 [Gordonia sp. ABSL1-1]|uniref:hypothetical protein n=1 Tax=Gordonia sp. ABSL1-1 TaxID=3053923 RepID=UPI002572542B|nr:hypothetical protein [Gordonia sp. ABSL1-1]MDL9937759.1 hypothetical protein [Gordonia sp. ABSL1-1]